MSCSVNSYMANNGIIQPYATAAPRFVWTVRWIGAPGETPPTQAFCTLRVTGSASYSVRIAGYPPFFGPSTLAGGLVTGWDRLGMGSTAYAPSGGVESTSADSDSSDISPLIDSYAETTLFTLHDAATNEWRATVEQTYLSSVQFNMILDGPPLTKSITAIGSITQTFTMYEINGQAV